MKGNTVKGQGSGRRFAIISPADCMVMLLCLAGAFFCLLFFWRNLNQTLSEQSALPVGTISWKHKVAQRRLEKRVLWSRLQQSSPVYNGDFIRTAEFSEASLTFTGGAVIDLAENSLIQIFTEDDIPLLHFTQGSVSIDASSATNETVMVLDAKGSQISAAGGTVLDARFDPDGNLTLRVTEGSASLIIDSENQRVDAGDAVILDPVGRTLEEGRTVVLSPKPVARLLQTENRPMPVEFTWNGVHYAASDITRIEIAPDREFKRILRTLGPASSGSGQTHARVELAPGIYFWRAYPVSAEGADTASRAANAALGKLTISYVPPSRVLSPAEGYEYRYLSRLPSVTFQWTASPEVSSYILEVADNPGLTNPVLQTLIRGGSGNTLSMTHSGLEKGRWYWRVIPALSDDWDQSSLEGFLAPQAPASFTITQSGTLAAPTLLSPPAESFINIASPQDLYFSWKHEPEAGSYTLLVSASPLLQTPVLTRQVTANYYTYGVKENLLGEGRYYWGVYQTGADGTASTVSPSRSFNVTQGELILRPVFPPHNYLVTGNQLPEFTWKTNLTDPLRFQVSGVPDFSRLAINEAAPGETFKGSTLDEGVWYWRITTGDGNIQTPVRSFIVALPPPAVILPPATPPAATSPAATPSVATPSVATPSVATSPAATPPVTTPSVATSPAATPSAATSSEATSPAATPPVTTPSAATPSVATSPVATPSATTPSVATSPAAIPPVTTPSAATSPVATPSATTPPAAALLKAARLFLPENDSRIGPDQLRETETITFAWDAVPGANIYNLALYREDGGKRQLVRQWESSAQTSRAIEVSLLGNGSFVWQVEACRRAADGSIAQRGALGENRFTLYLPALPRKTAKNPGRVYGQ
ncbi:hypothetical protein AGMMS4952_09940 [Spirochaetia bacterium]|nr:hypothetical protein AGMMS4952_09940 [Spirochaetia bacterium]